MHLDAAIGRAELAFAAAVGADTNPRIEYPALYSAAWAKEPVTEPEAYPQKAGLNPTLQVPYLLVRYGLTDWLQSDIILDPSITILSMSYIFGGALGVGSKVRLAGSNTSRFALAAGMRATIAGYAMGNGEGEVRIFRELGLQSTVIASTHWGN